MDMIRAFCIPEVKGIDVDERTVTHIITTASRDRAGDVIDVGGWELANYQRNPVVLTDHSYGIRAVIGKCLDIETSKKAIVATTQFAEVGAGFEAWNLVREGFVKSWSVGFKPLDGHPIRQGSKDKCKVCEPIAKKDRADDDEAWINGMHFTRQELLEYSLVAVPMNPDAVTLAVTRGLLSPDNLPLLTCSDVPSNEARQGATGQRGREWSDEGKARLARAIQRFQRFANSRSVVETLRRRR